MPSPVFLPYGDPMRTLGDRKNERGATAVEYGLLVVGVCLALILGWQAFGLVLRSIFEHENAKLCDTACALPSTSPSPSAN